MTLAVKLAVVLAVLLLIYMSKDLPDERYCQQGAAAYWMLPAVASPVWQQKTKWHVYCRTYRSYQLTAHCLQDVLQMHCT